MTTLNRLLRATGWATFIAILYALVAYYLDRPLIWPGVVGAFFGSFVVDMVRVGFRLVFQRPSTEGK